MILLPNRSHFGGSCGQAPSVKSCGLGQTMSGVIVAVRRTLLSCTSLARNGLIALGATHVSIVPSRASDFALLDAGSIFFEFNRQEIAVLTSAHALLRLSGTAD